MKRLFIFLPDALPETLDQVDWWLPGGSPDRSQAGNPAALPASDEIWLVLPASRVLLTQLVLSRRALRQLNGALGNALEERLMLDPAQVHIALGKAMTGDIHPVAVIEIAWLEQALALCRRQGIEAFGAIPETLVWTSEASLKETEASHWSARWRGHAGFVRCGASAGFCLDDGATETPPLALQMALAEARRNGTPPSAIDLETDVEVNAAAWSEVLDCPVQIQSLSIDTRPPAINLLQGPYASRRGRGWLADVVSSGNLARYRLAAGLVLAALGVHVLGTLADWARLSHDNSQLRAEMRQVFQETFPGTQAIVDPTLQMRRQLIDMRRSRGYSETGDFLHALNAVASQVGGVEGLSYENHRLTLAKPRNTDLDGLRGALLASGYQMTSNREAGNQSIMLEPIQP